MSTCKTCELVARRATGAAPLWDCIYQTQYWDLAHCYDSALPGWLVLIARRHIAALDELTENETLELGQLIRSVSIALKEVTGCIKMYVFQLAESPEHPHVHFHIVPRMEDLPDDFKSLSIFKYIGVPEEMRVSEEVMSSIAAKVHTILQTSQLVDHISSSANTSPHPARA